MPLIVKLKLLYPKVLVIIFVLISYAPIKLGGFGAMFPSVDLMLIYFWSTHRPELMKNWFVFCIGIFRDILSGAPLGLNALSNLILRNLAVYKKGKHVRHFILLWQGFALFLGMLLLFKWMVLSFVFDKMVDINTGIMQFLLTLVLYPIFHALFSSTYSTLPRSFSDA